MDNCSHRSTSTVEEKDSEVTSTAITADHTAVNKLGSALSGKLQINDERRIDNMNDAGEIHAQEQYVEEDEEEDDDFSEEELLAQMGYAKPQPEQKIRKPQRRYFEEEEEEEEEEGTSDCLRNEPPKHEPVTTSMADLNLVSALKGSREKQGKPAKGCRVSWAPDVYNPPSSTEQFSQSAIERQENEQKLKGAAGKKRNKGSRGRERAAGRDKKQGLWQWQQ